MLYKIITQQWFPTCELFLKLYLINSFHPYIYTCLDGFSVLWKYLWRIRKGSLITIWRYEKNIFQSTISDYHIFLYRWSFLFFLKESCYFHYTMHTIKAIIVQTSKWYFFLPDEQSNQMNLGRNFSRSMQEFWSSLYISVEKFLRVRAWHWEGWRACLHGHHFSPTGYCYFTGPRMIPRRKGTTIHTRDNGNVEQTKPADKKGPEAYTLDSWQRWLSDNEKRSNKDLGASSQSSSPSKKKNSLVYYYRRYST